MSGLNNRVPPPFVTLGLVAAMGGVSLLVPSAVPSWPMRASAAAVPLMMAAIFGPQAIRAFLRAGTTIDPVAIDRASTLVTTGIFSWTRNPMYVAMGLLLLAWAVWLGRLAPLFGPVIYIVYVTRFQILPEERALTARFGEAYAHYCRNVPRWLLF